MLELWRLLGRPAKGRLMLALILSAAAGASGVILLGLSGWFLTAAALAGLSGGGHAFNHLYPSAGVRASAFARVLARYGEQLVGHDATLGLSARLRPQLFAAAARSRRGFAPMAAADLSAITDDVDATEAGFLRVISPLFAIAASAAVALGFAFAADLLGGLVALCAVLFAGGVLPWRMVRANRADTAVSAGLLRSAREETARLVENVVELDTLDAVGPAAGRARDRLEAALAADARNEIRFQRASVLTGFAGALAALFLIWRGVIGQADMALSVAAALAVIAALDAAASMVSVLSSASDSEQAASRLAGRIAQPDADWNPPAEDAEPLAGVFPVVAENLMVAPAAGADPIGPLCFRIEAGDLVQLVGRSGSGKTTLAETLMRLQPMSGGQLTYRGVPAGRIRMANILEHVAYTPQLPAFLPGRLIDQLRLANPLAGDQEIARALKTACAEDFVNAAPGGLETVFAEGDYPFSGGELRRLAIARALIADPRLLILDEPLAGLDTELADKLAGNLERWAAGKGRSLLVIVHAIEPRFRSTTATIELPCVPVR
ncbi:MAG: ATP-binding cassette domain-containing protein [Alphaproteobacteria bacterium]|jgi:ATP-binding cassette subfamily C protein CydC|nr:ATP-binding cassette domain-containing protein [Alphaproteobacteria bacterium]